MKGISERDVAAVGLLDEPVRRQLYEWVVDQPEPVGREAAARAVGVSRALATFHLDRLVDGGLLQGSYRRLSGRVGPGAGRPARVYWRAPRQISVSIPERRYERAAALFATALERMRGGAPPTALTDAARDLGEQIAAAASRRGSERTRLRNALAAGGYEPVVDASGMIRLRNCPYDALAQAHRTLVCGTNLALAEGIAAGAAARQLQPVLDPQPGFCCVAFKPAPA